MDAPPIHKYTYRTEAFLNRHMEQGRATEFIENFFSGDDHDTRVLVFRGERGAGKSWLAHQFHQVLLSTESQSFLPEDLQGRAVKHPVDSFLICLRPGVEIPNDEQRDDEFFAPRGREETSEDETSNADDSVTIDVDSLVSDILSKLAAYIGSEDDKASSLLQRTQTIIQTIEKKVENKKQLFVLLLDSVFETDWAILQQLETFLLAPLVGLPNTAIIMTGRGPIPPWHSGDLRVDPTTHIVDLEIFNEEDVYNQISSYAQDKTTKAILDKFAPQIYEVSAGYPLNTTYIAIELPEELKMKDKNWADLSPDELNAAWVTVLNNLIDFLLDKSKAYRKDFEAISILQGYREWELAPVLDAYEPSANYADNQRKIRDKNNELLQTRLIQWSTKQKAYEMHEPVKNVLEEYLRRAKVDTWRNLHEAAEQLYLDMAEKHQKFGKEFHERAEYHKECLEASRIVTQSESVDSGELGLDAGLEISTENDVNTEHIKPST